MRRLKESFQSTVQEARSGTGYLYIRVLSLWIDSRGSLGTSTIETNVGIIIELGYPAGGHSAEDTCRFVHLFKKDKTVSREEKAQLKSQDWTLVTDVNRPQDTYWSLGAVSSSDKLRNLLQTIKDANGEPLPDVKLGELLNPPVSHTTANDRRKKAKDYLTLDGLRLNSRGEEYLENFMAE